MPHLLVDLEDMADCERGMQILKRRLGRRSGPRGCGPGESACGPGHLPEDLQGLPKRQRPAGEREWRSDAASPPATDLASLPLPQKLKRIQSRGMWKHLVKIARSVQEPSSLLELDALLDLPKNKMRSLKAIMAKLENRFGIQFLKVDPDAGVDASGNPRYVMLPKLRRQILRLADA